MTFSYHKFGVPINAYSTTLKTKIRMYIYQWIFIKHLSSQSGGYKKKSRRCGPCTQRTYNNQRKPSIKSPVCGVCVNLNLELGKTSIDEYVRKVGSKHIAREIEVEIWVDLDLVRNESDHPTEDGSSLDGLAIKRLLTQTLAPSKLHQSTFYLLFW